MSMDNGAGTYPRIEDEMPKVKIDVKNKRTLVKMVGGDLVMFGDWIRKYEAAVGLEEVPAGGTYRYTPAFDEVQYILSGKAKVKYVMPASRYTMVKEMTVEAGDAYVMVKGMEITWEVDPSGPLTRFCVVMPALLRYDYARFIAPGSIVELE